MGHPKDSGQRGEGEGRGGEQTAAVTPLRSARADTQVGGSSEICNTIVMPLNHKVNKGMEAIHEGREVQRLLGEMVV